MCICGLFLKNIFFPIATIGVTAEEEKGYYLASGSKDQTVRIWSTAKGKGEIFSQRAFTSIKV